MSRFIGWIVFARCSLLLLPLLLAACQKPLEIKPAYIHQDVHSSGSLVQIAADSELGVSAGLDGSLSLWDLASGSRIARWQAHSGPVYGLWLQPSDNLLLSGGWDGSLKQWDLSGKLIEEVPTGSPVTAMASNPAAGLLVSGHADSSIRYWSLPGLRQHRITPLQGAGIKSLAVHPASGALAASDTKGRVWYWHEDQTPRLIADLPVYIRDLEFSADGHQLFGGSWFDLYRWELPSTRLQVLDTDHQGIIAGIAWSNTNGNIVSISRQTDSSVLALDPASGKTLANYGKHELCGASVDISSDGKYLMTTSDDASVRIWLLGSQQQPVDKHAGGGSSEEY